ncbi:MAG: hypothetical protein WAP03_27285 [Methylorubrum rhodinum]|uniref:hypothetical protein n=1 Tax=Methylorubrum rhodinum TaxID=29428 RepID=UPI003BAE1F72
MSAAGKSLAARLAGLVHPRRRADALPADFDADLYLDLNADVAMAVEAGHIASAAEHWLHFGRRESRAYRLPAPTGALGGGIVGASTFRYPYRAVGALPPMEFAAPAIGPDDEAIAARLIAAWRHSAAAAPEAAEEGMWAARSTGFSAFHTALRAGDARALAALLAPLFQSHLAHGIAMGRTTAALARHAPEIFAAAWCDRLLRLAEALGVEPVRCPEQGDFARPLERVGKIERIEAALGFRLVFPDVGAPYGVRLREKILPEHAFSHAYAAWRIRRLNPGPRLAEIGGGFGGLAWFLRDEGRSYTILDLPFTNVIQGWFLLKAGLSVSLAGEPEARLRVLPWWEIHRDARYDLVINQDSIPEMPPDAAAMYVARIREIAPLFYSVNQEAAAANTEAFRQGIVPNLVARDGGYRRLGRNPFWLRDGYVEEIYARRDTEPPG